MHIKVNKTAYKGKETLRAYLVQSVRTSKGPRHEVLHNFGEVTRQEGERLQRAFRYAENQNAFLATSEEVKGDRSLELGSIAPGIAQWKPLGLEGILEKKKEEGLLKTLVINRCVDPMSKIAVMRWYPKTALPALLGLKVSEVNKHRSSYYTSCAFSDKNF